MDRVTVLWEIEQIKQLKARYLRLLDLKKWDQYRELFTDDYRFYVEPDREPVPGTQPTDTNADDFVRRLAGTLQVPAVSVHQGHMPEIEITGENSARGIWALYEFIDDPKRDIAFKGMGHYHEVYAKGADGKWRIKETHVTRMRLNQFPPTPEAQLVKTRPDYSVVKKR